MREAIKRSWDHVRFVLYLSQKTYASREQSFFISVLIRIIYRTFQNHPHLKKQLEIRTILKSWKMNIDARMNELWIGLTPKLSPLFSMIVTLSLVRWLPRHFTGGVSLQHLLVHLDESAEVCGHFADVLRFSDYSRGQTGERGVPQWTNQIIKLLIIQQHLERLSIIVYCVKMRAGVEQIDRHDWSPRMQQRGKM